MTTTPPADPRDRSRRRPAEGGRPEARRGVRAAVGLAADLEAAPQAEVHQGEEGGAGQARKRLKAAGVRRFYGAQSRRPRPWQNRIGSAAARRDTRALSRMRHSNAWLW
ncbi:hypothetical protein Slala03_77720 [Streptomyces lavendulae subsp. lavendulae]|uniref:hypothetical protein n=1 Tax=Streptomyces lavendulae TaxID=1914 RepID=UPI0024A13518|nr:hypothetical protein Slala03_77720 [Streptomyces lavendulae subsp. lavendulae]